MNNLVIAKMKLKKLILSILGIGMASAAGLSGFEEMRYLQSYETLAFETADGDLGLNEYVIIRNNTLLPLKVVKTSRIPAYTENTLYLIREVPKDKGSWKVTNDTAKIVGKKEVKFRCEACIYFSEFIDRNGEKYRKQIAKPDYDGMRYIKGFRHPKETEFVLGKQVRAAPTFDATVNNHANAAATSYTLPMTLGSISNPALVVTVRKNALGNTVDSVTYNAVTMTRERKASSGGGADREIESFVLINPTTGSAQNIVASYSASTWSGISASSYSGSNQTTLIGAENSAGAVDCTAASGVTTTLTSSSTDSTIVSTVQGIRDGSGVFTEQGSLVERGATICANCGEGSIGDMAAATIQAYSVQWKPDSDTNCQHIILEIQGSPVAAAAEGFNSVMIISD